MQNIVVEDENAAKQCIRLLDRERKGRATFLPMTAVRGRRMDDREFAGMEGAVGIASSLVTAENRYSGIVEHLLGRILIAEDLDCAVTIAKRCGYKFRIVTLDGQVINTGGAMTGGYTAKSAGLLGRRGEIDQLEAEAAPWSRRLRNRNAPSPPPRRRSAASKRRSGALTPVCGRYRTTASGPRVRRSVWNRSLLRQGNPPPRKRRRKRRWQPVWNSSPARTAVRKRCCPG